MPQTKLFEENIIIIFIFWMNTEQKSYPFMVHPLTASSQVVSNFGVIPG